MTTHVEVQMYRIDEEEQKALQDIIKARTRTSVTSSGGGRRLRWNTNVETWPWAIDANHFEKTPQRWLRVLEHYSQEYDPKNDLGVTFRAPGAPVATYEEHTKDIYTRSLIMQKNIPFRGLCAHHLLPVLGRAHVCYIPRNTMVGLSKLSRVVNGFSHLMPNTQEQIGEWVADALDEHLDPLGAACIIDAEHTCMASRGVEEHAVATTTAALRGVFTSDASARAELYANIDRGAR